MSRVNSWSDERTRAMTTMTTTAEGNVKIFWFLGMTFVGVSHYQTPSNNKNMTTNCHDKMSLQIVTTNCFNKWKKNKLHFMFLSNSVYLALMKVVTLLLASATKLRRLCFYRRLSVHRGEGVSASVHGGIHPPPQEQTPPPQQTP